MNYTYELLNDGQVPISTPLFLSRSVTFPHTLLPRTNHVPPPFLLSSPRCHSNPSARSRVGHAEVIWPWKLEGYFHPPFSAAATTSPPQATFPDGLLPLSAVRYAPPFLPVARPLPSLSPSLSNLSPSPQTIAALLIASQPARQHSHHDIFQFNQV